MIKSRKAEWYLAKIRYERTMSDGLEKKVMEQYCIDAMSFTEAEQRIIDEMSEYISGEFEVKGLSQCPFMEVFFSDSETADRWFKAKLQLITVDEKTGRERRSPVNYLVQAGSFNSAVSNIDEAMKSTMIDYVISSISETAICDVFEYQPKTQSLADESTE